MGISGQLFDGREHYLGCQILERRCATARKQIVRWVFSDGYCASGFSLSYLLVAAAAPRQVAHLAAMSEELAWSQRKCSRS
jgi:hypothetical protein